MTTTKEFFDIKFAKKVQEDPMCLAATGVKGDSIGLDVSGSNGGQWTFCFDATGKLDIQKGLVSPGCTVETKDETFEGMIKGTVNVPMAFLMRKIKVKGDSQLAVKLGLALQTMFKK